MSLGSKVLVLGGTGPAGICLIRELLHRGHATIVYARSPSKIPLDLSENPLLEVIEGEMTDDKKLGSAISQCTAIVSLLGPSQPRPNDAKDFPTHYSDHVFPLMREHSIKRIYAMGTISITRQEDQPSLLRWLAIALFRLVYPKLYSTMIDIERTFDSSATDLEWLVFRIAAIPGDSDEASWLSDRGDGDPFVGWVAGEGWSFSMKRGALARWLVDAVEGKADEWIGNMPAVSKMSGSKRKSE